jgi:hypothetical protein
VPRPRSYATEADRRRAQNDRRHARVQAHDVEFCGVDGEGTGRGRDHRYVLLGVGQEYVSNSDGLQFPEIAAFLYEQYQKRPNVAFVGFFLGYDFTQWFKTLPEGRARVLLTPTGIATRKRRTEREYLGPFPVGYGDWEFDILGMKRFKLRPKGEKGWMYVNDAGPFFQQSFLKVIDPSQWKEPICTEEEYDAIQEGKAKRDSAVLDSDMVRYNGLENAILSRVMARLNEGFTNAGVRLRKDQWFGPGQAAQAWMHTTPLPLRLTLSEQIPLLAFEAGRLTYYGGWFEIFAHGHIPGISFEYDINSAYPCIAASLPCLLHGKWSAGHGIPGTLAETSIRADKATVSSTDPYLGSMLHRTGDGTIRRPSATRGWFWQSELDAAVRAGAVDRVEYEEWIEYEPCKCEPPLRDLAVLYVNRQSVGKNSPAGKAYKLLYNSVYGKLAQSVGDNPKYANAIYASLITSGCRRMILDAIATHPAGSRDLLMVATDGVYFSSPHPGLPLSSDLGDWEEGTHTNLTLFKPGVYWDDNARERVASGESASFKARGINAGEFARQLASIDAHFGKWPERYPAERDPDGPREGWYPKVKYTSGFSMVTCQQALQRHKWFLAGSVNEAELVQDADPISKRHSGEYVDGIFRSHPFKDGGPVFDSYPYDKTFGQPDPEEYGITDDGTVLDAWKGLLSG